MTNALARIFGRLQDARSTVNCDDGSGNTEMEDQPGSPWRVPPPVECCSLQVF